ncbi:MAG: branched-chain amino acid ABC transporter permease [Caldilineaceae bacterium]
MENSSIFLSAMLWIFVWGVLGGIVTPRIYARRDLDISQASLGGAAVGAALGPIGLIPLWIYTPRFTARLLTAATIFIVGIIAVAFARADPTNLCVTNGSFVISQLSNGLVIGVIYSLMALGLTLIYSILGVVSFAHGEFYMIGGMVVYYLSVFPAYERFNAQIMGALQGRYLLWFGNTAWYENWEALLLAIPGSVLLILSAAIVTFVLGALFELLFLRVMNTGQIERPKEYAILVTFGLAFFLQYLVQALAGANPVKVQRLFPFPSLDWPSKESNWLLSSSPGNLRLFDAISIPNPRFTAAVISVVLLLLLLWFLFRTWTGRGLRAVSQDQQAAAVAGINPNTMNTLAFGMGAMLAGVSGASLAQVFAWLPQVGIPAAGRSFVIIVLGGMGSLPGAFIGGIIVGLIEMVGVGCIPDPSRAAAYLPAYGMIILTLTLLLKPTGFFGKEL